MPKATISTDAATGEVSYYPTGMLYLLCAFASLVATLGVYTYRLREQVASPHRDASR